MDAIWCLCISVRTAANSDNNATDALPLLWVYVECTKSEKKNIFTRSLFKTIKFYNVPFGMRSSFGMRNENFVNIQWRCGSKRVYYAYPLSFYSIELELTGIETATHIVESWNVIKHFNINKCSQFAWQTFCSCETFCRMLGLWLNVMK